METRRRTLTPLTCQSVLKMQKVQYFSVLHVLCLRLPITLNFAKLLAWFLNNINLCWAFSQIFKKVKWLNKMWMTSMLIIHGYPHRLYIECHIRLIPSENKHFAWEALKYVYNMQQGLGVLSMINWLWRIWMHMYRSPLRSIGIADQSSTGVDSPSGGVLPPGECRAKASWLVASLCSF